MTPRRGRAKHGLVGPVNCFARTADEMISASLQEGSAELMRSLETYSDAAPRGLIPSDSARKLNRRFLLGAPVTLGDTTVEKQAIALKRHGHHAS